jgi:single-strand DNA-binding protein
VNDIHVTLRGNVATEPRHVTFDDGNTVTSFRLASNSRWFDRERREWVSRGTTYVNVTCRRAMAINAQASIHKGDPVVVIGRLRERFWSANGRSGQSIEVDAEILGHDLSFGTSQFARVVRLEQGHRVSDPAGDEMAYQLAADADHLPGDPDGEIPRDLSGFTVLDDDEPGRPDEPELSSAAA